MATQHQVRAERTGWRDERISARHRMWGWDVPVVDVDWVVVEYDKGKAVALVEYKAQGAQPPHLQHPTYRALAGLATAAQIPFVVVFYQPQDWVFYVVPVNRIAHTYWREPVVMTEREFVQSLYQLRSRKIADEILRQLNHHVPESVQRWLSNRRKA